MSRGRLHIMPYIAPEDLKGWNQSRFIMIPKFESAVSGVKNWEFGSSREERNVFQTLPSYVSDINPPSLASQFVHFRSCCSNSGC